MEPRNVRDAFDEEFDNVTLGHMKHMAGVFRGFHSTRNIGRFGSITGRPRTKALASVANKDDGGARVAPAARAGSKTKKRA
jgi:hypothetical protein